MIISKNRLWLGHYLFIQNIRKQVFHKYKIYDIAKYEYKRIAGKGRDKMEIVKAQNEKSDTYRLK